MYQLELQAFQAASGLQTERNHIFKRPDKVISLLEAFKTKF